MTYNVRDLRRRGGKGMNVLGRMAEKVAKLPNRVIFCSLSKTVECRSPADSPLPMKLWMDRALPTAIVAQAPAPRRHPQADATS